LQQKKEERRSYGQRTYELMVEDFWTRAYTPRLIDKKAPTTTSGHERDEGFLHKKLQMKKVGFSTRKQIM
jgi:hypothetical protein